MLRNLTATRCVHCLDCFIESELTADHIVPASWYPRSFPKDKPKPHAPSCKGCNSRLGRVERALLVRIGLCLDPSSCDAAGIAEKAMRAVNSSAGVGRKDSEHRRALRQKVLNEIVPRHLISVDSIIPGFGPPAASMPSEQIALGLEKKLVDALGEKLVRGATYLFSRIYIEPGHEIITGFFRPGSNPYLEVLDRFARCMELGPGFRMRRAGDAPEDIACGLFEFVFWNRFDLYSAVTRTKAASGASVGA